MAHHDPTLPRPDIDALPEADLIARVKGEQDSAALVALVNRHSGMYFSVVNRYAAAYPNVIKAHDMDDDKMFNLYTFIQAYDATRGTKLSSYIHDRTDYMCKVMLKRDTRNVLSAGTYSSTGAMSLDMGDDTYSTTNGGQVTLEDQTATSRVADQANIDVGIEDIKRAAGEVCADPRFSQILECRHGAGHGMSWRAVAEKMGVSHERCRQLYLTNLALVKEHLNT